MMKKVLPPALAVLAMLAAVRLFARAPVSFDPEKAISEFRSQARQIQETHAAQQAKIRTLRVDTKLVLVDVAVKNAKGNQITGLKKEDFKIFEDGYPQTVAELYVDKLPLAVALVLDASGSMQAYLKALARASRVALATLKPEDQVAVFIAGPGPTAADNGVLRIVDLTSNRQIVEQWIETTSRVNTGDENLDGGLYVASRYLRENAPGMRRAVILMSDDVQEREDRVGLTTESGLLLNGGPSLRHGTEEEIEKGDVSVYNIMIGNQLYRDWARQIWFPWFQKLIDRCGGEVFSTQTHSPNEVGQAFERIISDLKTRYTLGYYPTDHPDPSDSNPPQKAASPQPSKEDSWNDDGNAGSQNKKEPQNPGKHHTIRVDLDPKLDAKFGGRGQGYKIFNKKGYYSKISGENR